MRHLLHFFFILMAPFASAGASHSQIHYQARPHERNAPQNVWFSNSVDTPPALPETRSSWLSSLFKAGTALGMWVLAPFKGGQVVQGRPYICSTHQEPVTLSVTPSDGCALLFEIKHRCSIEHEHFPRDRQEADWALRLQEGMEKGIPMHLVPRDRVSYQFEMPAEGSEAFRIPIERDIHGNMIGLAGHVESHAVREMVTCIRQQSDCAVLQKPLQEIEKAAQASIKTGSVEALHETLTTFLAEINYNAEQEAVSVDPEYRGHVCEGVQKSLIGLSCDRVLHGDVAGAINAAYASMIINQAVGEGGTFLYTNYADRAIRDIATIYSRYALVKLTGMHLSTPMVAQQMIFGQQGERLYLAPYLKEKLDLGPKCCAALRGIEKGAIHFVHGTKELVLHPVATTKKTIWAAIKIVDAVDHFLTNDFMLKFRRDLLLARQAHKELGFWEKQELIRVLDHIAARQELPTIRDACVAARNLTVDDIKTAALYLSSEQGIERAFQGGTELGLGVLTGKALGGALGTLGNSLGGGAAVLEEFNTAVVLADGTVVAIADGVGLADMVADSARQVAALAEMGVLPAQLLSNMDGNGKPQQGAAGRPPLSDTQVRDQRVDRLVRESKANHRKLMLENQYSGKSVKAVEVTSQQLHCELAQELKIVQRSEVELAHVKGIEKTIESFDKAALNGSFPAARGASYELETALKVAQEEPVVGLGLHKHCGGASREMDIITKSRYIECKNIDWTRLDASRAGKLRDSFGAQAKIAQGHGLIFEVHSKQPISSQFKAWFKKKGICYVEA